MQNEPVKIADISQGPSDDSSRCHNLALQRSLLIVLFLYLVFVLYGSLVPLQFVPISLDEALLRYSQIRYLTLGMQSRADWVANILLFIPLAFLLCAVSFKDGHKLRNLVLGCCIVLFGFSLALCIEFIQLYFPQRTVSINDIIAETLGATIGVILYSRYGSRFKRFLLGLTLVRGQASVISYLLLIYSTLFFLYYLLPLDLTLSPVELYKKWHDGRIVLLPFSAYKGSLVEISYAMISDIVLWLPITILWLASNPEQPKLVFYSRLLLLACLLEFCQLFVYSRVTDVSDIICALLAGIIAQYSLTCWRRHKGKTLPAGVPQPSNQQLIRTLLWCSATLLYSIFLILLFWYPFNFNFDWSFIHARWQVANSKVLLHSLYFGTEFRAITALSQKVLTFIPLGVFIAVACQTLQKHWHRQLFAVGSLLFAISLAAVIEAMQLALPGKTVDLTDALLQVTGLAIGFAGYLFFSRRAAASSHQTAVDSNSPSQSPRKALQATSSILTPTRLIVTHLLITVFLLFLVRALPMLPYNIRELLNDNNTAIVGLALSFYLMTLPLLMPRRQFAVFTLYSPALILAQSLLVFVVLFVTVPRESLHDILGAPVTNMPVMLELLLRFCGFFGLFLFNYLFAWRLLLERSRFPAMILYAFVSLFYAALWYLTVVQLAATDNITELLANSGSYTTTLGLSLYLALLCGSAAYLSRFIVRDKALYSGLPSNRYWRLAGLVIGILLAAELSWQLLNAITENLIIKYQQVFSALQFLLSTDRDSYVLPAELKLRYAIVHFALIILLAWFYIWAQQLARITTQKQQGAAVVKEHYAKTPG